MKDNLDTQTLNSGHMHEACDRTYMLADSFEEVIVNHPAVQNNPDLREKAEAISEALWNLYQEAGNEWALFDQTNIENTPE